MFIVSWHLTKEQQHKNTYLVIFFLFTTHVYIESILLFWHFKTQASEASSHKAFFSLSPSLSLFTGGITSVCFPPQLLALIKQSLCILISLTVHFQ